MEEQFQILETKYWKVILHENQAYLGYSIVILKSRAKSMSDISKDEWVEFQEVVKTLESGFKKAFNATMFNWTRLMNHAYKKNPPQPRVHWHLRPRYKEKVEIQGEIFEDLEFAHNYNKERRNIVSKEIQELIVKQIKNNL